MAKLKEGAKLYEVTRERPATPFEMVLSVGSIGAAVGFFMTLVIGACTATFTMDGLLLLSLVFSVVGFALGLGVGWIILKYLGDLLNVITNPKPEVTSEPVPVVSNVEPPPVVEENEGKSVDYTFPEFSSDNQ